MTKVAPRILVFKVSNTISKLVEARPVDVSKILGTWLYGTRDIRLSEWGLKRIYKRSSLLPTLQLPERCSYLIVGFDAPEATELECAAN